MKKKQSQDEFSRLLSMMFKSHPWHGVSPGEADSLSAYIEIVPSDAVKLELDKATGHLSVDRPQTLSSLCPMLYGFVPQTYCAERVAKDCEKATGLKNIVGDGDPLDICVLTEKEFSHGDLFVKVRPIGGLRMVDHGEADDKIVAVLENDVAYGHLQDISECPEGLITRLKHYFLSYKRPPDSPDKKKNGKPVVAIWEVYDRDAALHVIEQSKLDYNATYGTPEERLSRLRELLKG